MTDTMPTCGLRCFMFRGSGADSPTPWIEFMKPYGQKLKMNTGKKSGHSSDNCGVCNNGCFKVSKKRARQLARIIWRIKPPLDWDGD